MTSAQVPADAAQAPVDAAQAQADAAQAQVDAAQADAQAQAPEQLPILSYYTLNSKNYITSFPTTYFPLKKGTGHECDNCTYYASIGDVLLGFCRNCCLFYNCNFVELVIPHYLHFGDHITEIEIETIKSILSNGDSTLIDETHCTCALAWLSDSESDEDADAYAYADAEAEADADADSETYHELNA